jgi:uncharacterized membrane protein YphA (DoxX/SURF4 family)
MNSASMNSSSFDLAVVFLRLGVAYVMIYAAWKNTQNRAAWTWTVNETAIMFRALPEARRLTIVKLAAFAGMIMMYGGGFSISAGVEPRLGGLFIAVFCALGTRIHAIRRDEAKAAADAGNPMGWSAYSAHVAAGLKNWALVGAGLFFVVAGVRGYGLGIDYVGKFIGFRD